jgi:hypothetical protein
MQTINLSFVLGARTKITQVFTGVHYLDRECNTAMSVIAYHTLPGVRILHSVKRDYGSIISAR